MTVLPHSYGRHVDPPTEWTSLEPGPATPSPERAEHDSVPVIRPQGLPLTETMPFLDDGVAWVAYVEGFPRESPRFLRRTMLPGRRLRFDSNAGSWVSLDLPAGAPFLSHGRLGELLRCAQPFPPPALPARAQRRVVGREWMLNRVGRTARWGRTMAGWMLQCWRQDKTRVASRWHLAMVTLRRRA